LERIAGLKEIEKGSVEKIIFFGKGLLDAEIDFLKTEFGFNSNDVDFLISKYRNIGMVLRLMPLDDGFSNWGIFINRVIVKTDILSKLNNVFISPRYNKVLLLTTKRLIQTDIRKLNEKIRIINEKIIFHNKKAKKQEYIIKNSIENMHHM